MAFSSLRLLLLGAIERILRRWLDSVTAQINAAPVPTSATNEDRAVEPRQPDPPEHWLEVVRQHAPQLLDGSEANDATVYDYRSDDTGDDVFQVTTRTPKARSASVITPHPRADVPVPVVKTSSKRPMRLGSVCTQAVDSESVEEYSAQTKADALEIPILQATLPDAPELPHRRADEMPVQPLPTYEAAEFRDEQEIAPHFADLPLERHVREIRQQATRVPTDVDVTSVRTRAGKSVHLNQRRTSVPKAPEQTVLRPTTLPTQINIDEVTPERWASLPEEPTEPPPDARDAHARRERLKHEQEGRAWNV